MIGGVHWRLAAGRRHGRALTAGAARLWRQQQRQQQQRRCLHKVPPLEDEDAVRAEGYPGFLSQHAVRIAWTEYQGHIVERLNEKIAGTPMQDMDVKAILVHTARDPANAALFNYASMAFNNHFFFKYIASRPSERQMTSTVEEMVKDSFSSRDALRAQLVDTASAMFGPGFVWLVKRRDDAFRKGKSLAVLATYNAGSPLHEAHYRRQSIDMNTLPGTSLADVSGDLLRRQTEVQNSPGAFGYQQDKKPPSLLELQPLLCVNTWEHVWLPDWGVAGKDAYLDAWWARINWQAVDAVINADHSANRGRGWRNNYHWSRPAPE